MALQQPPVARRRLRDRSTIFALVAALAYIAGLVALIPARILIDESDSLKVGGTIWNGEAVFGSAIRMDWQFAPLRTLAALAPSADVHLAGAGTDLAGQAARQSGGLVLTDLSGQVDGTLLDVMAPDIPFSCRFVAQARIPHLALGGATQSADATLRLSTASCSPRGGAALPVALPASQFVVRPVGALSTGGLTTIAGRQRLLELRLSRQGNLSVWPTGALTRTAPALAGIRYDTRIE